MFPINLQTWIDNNQASLKPPVCNKQIFEQGDFIIMAVGGPNTRHDFHIDAYDEFFYQLDGTLEIDIIEKNAADEPVQRTITVPAGHLFLLPAFVPHRPRRSANSFGLVVERKRAENILDHFAWYCSECSTKIHQVDITLDNIETDLPPLFEAFYADKTKHCCVNCGHLNIYNKPEDAERHCRQKATAHAIDDIVV